MRLRASAVAILLVLFAALPGAALAADEPKVAVVVGPAGEATAEYRDLAEAAARVAERYTSNVVRVYSPNATWRAARQALDGAAVVIYLGHGNGWPSPYRDSLFGSSQNGLGLNPVEGGGDDAVQYFGEDPIAAEISLARNSVVLLHRLCYASGNSEPGLPEGTLDEARQRVANYGAGFIRAGAGAVVADAFTPPAWYVEQLFNGSRSVDRIWLASPRANGNEFSWESSRSPGFTAAMDPDTGDSGFYRSIVYRGGVGAGRLEPATTAGLPLPAEASLVGTGLEIDLPYFKAPPIAGTQTRLWFPYETEEAAALEGLTVGVRWDPIDVAGSPEPDVAATTEEEAAESDVPADEQPDPLTGELVSIEPQRRGDVVEPVTAVVGETRIVADVTLPALPGRYALVTTLHDKDGVAYDAPTQQLVSPVIVHVSGELGARFLAPASATAEAGAALELPVGVANVGSRPWGREGSTDRQNVEERPSAAVVTARWVALDVPPGEETSVRPVTVRLPAGMVWGQAEQVVLALTAPETRGSYLVVIDVVVPGEGSLAAHGSEPALVRVTVE